MRGTYDINKYRLVEVKIEKDDYALENLMEDLEGWCRHLYLVEDIYKGYYLYKGLLPIKEVEHLYTLTCMSPYGNGYDVLIEGLNYTKLNDRYYQF